MTSTKTSYRHLNTHKEDRIMSSVKENSGVIKLANGNTISIDDYVNKQEAKKVVRDLLLGTITSVKTLDNGRFYITPCWADEHGDDNICAFVSKNRKIEKDDIVLGQVVLFSVGKDFQHEGKFIALDVQVYNKDSDIEFKTERPADYPTNVSKSRQTYIEKIINMQLRWKLKRQLNLIVV